MSPHVFLINTPQHPYLNEQTRLVCDFYGLQLHTVPTEQALSDLTSQLDHAPLAALIIHVDALKQLNVADLNALLQFIPTHVPLLLSGFRAENWHKDDLIAWTQDSIQSVNTLETPTSHYQISDTAESQQLADMQAEFNNTDCHYFDSAAPALINIKTADNSNQPFFIKNKVAQHTLYYLAHSQATAVNGKHTWRLTPENFLSLAPLFMLLRHTFADYAWHRSGCYANLTIDDPWLTEPYGLLNFKALLVEMKKVGYHSTMAYIPWNYDRSDAKTLQLFKDNPDFYSLCVHGNNHDHREFYKYNTEDKDPWVAKPLALQTHNIRQGLARMTKFSQRTGLDYDRVMVFPHGIAPEATLGVLKQHNYLATFNVVSIPLGSPIPTDGLFHLRAESLNFANFTSFWRDCPDEYSHAEIAIDQFLGNPLVFFEHQTYFATGIDAFNSIATFVNQKSPATQWCNLKTIAEKAYIQRHLGDNQYEIKAFGRSLNIDNNSEETRHYQLHKAENFEPEIAQLLWQGQPCEYQRVEHELLFNFSLPAHSQGQFEIQYQNDFVAESIHCAKDNKKMNRLRWFSDFRDIQFSRHPAGQWFLRHYYGSNAYQGGIKKVLFAALGVSLMLFVAIFGRKLKV